MKYPSARDFRRFVKRLPWWVVPLVLLLLFGRFVIMAFFQG